MRVVSLLPSATESLRLLAGPDDPRIQLVGSVAPAARAAGMPAGVKGIPSLTSRRAGESPPALDTQMLAALKPDIILTGDLPGAGSIDPGAAQQVAAALDPPPRVLSFNPQSVEQVLDDILTLAEAIGRPHEGARVVVGLRERLARATEHVPAFAHTPSVAFLHATDPLVAGGCWIPQLIERAGGAHPLNPTVPRPGAGAASGAMQSERLAGGPRQITPEALVASRPDYLIICPRGLNLDQTRQATAALTREPWFADLPAARATPTRVALIDGSQMFNRPGPRLVEAQEWLVAWLHGRPIPAGFPWEQWGGA